MSSEALTRNKEYSRRSQVARLKKRIGELSLNGYGIGGYLFLYLPILILVFFS